MRNWARDWELCKKATPGPWKVSCLMGDTRIVATDLCGNSRGLVAKIPDGRHWPNSSTNAEFIAEAREALPYWLQRVREMEGDIESLEIMLGMKDVPPPRTWVPTEWLQNLEEAIKIAHSAWPYIWQLTNIYKTHDHPEIEARPIIDVLDEMFIKFQRAYFKQLFPSR